MKGLDGRAIRRQTASVWFSLAVYGVVVLWIMGPALWHPRSLYPGYPDDPEQYMWYLGWFWHAMLHGQNPLVARGTLNYPTGINLMWNTSILTEAVLFGPLARLVNGVFAYNALFLVNLLGICVLGEVLLRQLGVRPALARLGGLLTGLLPYETAQSTGHISITVVVPLLAMPVLLLAARRRSYRRPVLWGALMGLVAASEFYTSLEVTATATLAATVFLLFSLFLARRQLQQLVEVPRRLPLSALAMFLLLALPGLLVFLFGPYRPHGVLQPQGVYVTDLLNPLLPSQLYWLHTTATVDWVALFSGNTAESDGYLGIVALLLALLAFFRGRRRPLVPVLFGTAITMTLLAFGPALRILGKYTGIPLPWTLFGHVPLLDSVLPTRLMLYTDLALVGVVILGAEEMVRTSRRPLWLWGALALMVLTWLPALPYPHTSPPASGQALAACQDHVCQALGGQPTYVLVGYFPPVMAALADAHFAFPVANVYGHSPNGYRRKVDLLAPTAIFQPQPPTPAHFRHLLRTVLPQLQVRRLLYLSLGSRGTLSPKYRRAISAVLGPPLAKAPGVLVWRVPPGLTH